MTSLVYVSNVIVTTLAIAMKLWFCRENGGKYTFVTHTSIPMQARSTMRIYMFFDAYVGA